MSIQVRFTLIAASLMLFAGCNGESEETTGEQSSVAQPSAAGEQYILDEEPEGAVEVIAARESAEDDADIVVVGRIGGDVNPWVDDVAAFTIVDTSLVSCDEIEGDVCPTPWDYCCAAGVPDAITLVTFVDDDGNPVETGAQELLGLDELQTVVVKGKAQRDADGNLSILASHVFVRPHVDRPTVEAGSHAHSHDHDHAHSHEHEHEDGDASEAHHEHDHDHVDEHAEHEHGHADEHAEHEHDHAHSHEHEDGEVEADAEHEHDHADEDAEHEHEHVDEDSEHEHDHSDEDTEHDHADEDATSDDSDE